MDKRLKKLKNFVNSPEVTHFNEAMEINEKLDTTNERLSIANEALKAIAGKVSEPKESVVFPEYPEFPNIPEPKEVIFPEVQKIAGTVKVENPTDLKPLIDVIKGLEFNKVYLFGFNSNKLKDFEEAKKFFVGATRAMNELVIFN